MSGTDLTEILPDINRAARTIALEWPGVIDYDDAVQEIALALLADNYTDDVIDMDEAARRHVLKKIGQHIAVNYRTEFDRYSDQYRYATWEVRRSLERGALTEQPAVFDAATADIKAAFRKLNEGYRFALAERYINGREPGDSAERKRVTRAIDAVTEQLNRTLRVSQGHNGPGARRAMSNAQAAAIARRTT